MTPVSLSELEALDQVMTEAGWTTTPDLPIGIAGPGGIDSILMIDRDGMACVYNVEDGVGIAVMRNAFPALLAVARAALALDAAKGRVSSAGFAWARVAGTDAPDIGARAQQAIDAERELDRCQVAFREALKAVRP